ncbi:hypothetical protein AB2553_24740 [Bacillus mycoides]|uniref:hypothetical protein n=1 Tax=Bacillus mycoides TaxID=1405 RepID=UPI003463FFE7
MSGSKRRYTLSYYEEHKKEEILYHISEKDFYDAELRALEKMAEVKNLDYKRKNRITLTNNKNNAVYTANWSKVSPVIDKKGMFYLKNFSYYSPHKQKKKNLWLNDILLIELSLLILIVPTILVMIYNYVPKLAVSPKKILFEALFLFILVIIQLMKEFLYEKIRDIFKSSKCISSHIFIFEMAIGYGTFTTMYSVINGKNSPIEQGNQLITTIYVIGLLVLTAFIIIRVNKVANSIKNRDMFHNQNG